MTFSAAPDPALAGGNVVRIRAGSIGSTTATTTGLIAQDVTSGAFTATAAAGDIHLGDVTSTGDVLVTAAEGSVTGLSTRYAPATGVSISGSDGATIDAVLLDITGSAAIGSITADTVRTIGNGTSLRIGTIEATTVNLGAVQTLDVGTVTAGGTVDLATTGGTADVRGLEILVPGTLLANDGDDANDTEDFGSANLFSTASDGRVAIGAANGIAQLGTVQAGTGTGLGGTEQISVTARALTIAQADALDGSLVVTASDGLLSLDAGTARQHVSLVKRNDDGTSAGSASTTDILKVGETTGLGGSITAGFGVDISSETALVVNRVTALGNDPSDGAILVTAAGDLLLTEATAMNGSIGLLGGGSIRGDIGASLPGTLTAAGDVAIRAEGDVQYSEVTAGDDVDLVSTGGDLLLRNVTSMGGAAIEGLTGTSVAFPGLPGEAGSLSVGIGEDAALADSTIRLRAAAGDILSSAPGLMRTQGAGDILVNAGNDVQLDQVNAGSGSIGVLAGGDIRAANLTASSHIGVMGGVTGGPSNVVSITATAGEDIDVTAVTGDLFIQATSTGIAAPDPRSVAFIGAPGAADGVGVVSGEDGEHVGASIRAFARSGNVTASSLVTGDFGNVFVSADGDVEVITASAADGSIGLLAGGDVTAATLNASRDILVQGGTGASIAAASAGDDIDIVALGGNLSLQRGTSTGAVGAGGTSVVIDAAPGQPGSLRIDETEDPQLTASTIRLRAVAGDIASLPLVGDPTLTGTLRTQGAGDVLVNASGNAALNAVDAAGGSVGVLAGGQVSANTLAASRDIGVQTGGGIAVSTATAGDDIDIVALGGDLVLTDGTSTGAAGAGGTSLAFGATPGAAAATGSVNGEDAQMAGASIRLRAANGNATSTGTLRTQGVGDVLVNARRDVMLAATTASAGSVALLAGGSLTAATTSASEDVSARAAADAALAAVTAGDDIEITAGRLVTTGTGRIGTTGSGLDARHAVFDAAQAGQAAAITLAAGDPRGPKGMPGGSPLANTANGRSIIIEAADVDVQGVLDSTPGGRITLRNTGAGATLVGDGTIATGSGFALANAELGRLRTGTLVVDSGNRALELGTMTIGTATGTTDTRFLATGTVEITGPLTVAGSAERTLQIGGLLVELGDNAGTVPLATSLIARIDRASRPSIDAGAAHVDLRAGKILFGTSAMVDEYIGLTNEQIAAIVADPSSRLYGDAAAQPLDVFLTAGRVTVGYSNFALFQNTDINGSTGVLINSPLGGQPDQTAPALQLVSTGEAGNNSFAMFGVVNNVTGTPAALLPNEAIEIVNPTGNPNDLRITRANSRLNGCVIGAPDDACHSTEIPRPEFNFYDERKVALFDDPADEENAVASSPLIAPGNDRLVVTVDGPVGVDPGECRPEDPGCPATGNK